MGDIVENMKMLATKWHEGQFRKGPERLPYIVHPEAVVQKLRDWGYNDQYDAVTLAVAWGHDLLEDTKCPEADILASGGAEVLAGIRTLTFTYTNGIPDAEYDRLKAAYVEGIAKNASPEILVVKLADRLCNAWDFFNAGRRAKAKDYVVNKGESVFARVAETKHPDAIVAERDRLVAMCE